MAGPSSDAALKRKLADVDVDANWAGHDLEQALQEKRALEEAEEYNTPDVRQRAKQIGIQEARTSVSDVSKMYAKDVDRHSSPSNHLPGSNSRAAPTTLLLEAFPLTETVLQSLSAPTRPPFH